MISNSSPISPSPSMAPCTATKDVNNLLSIAWLPKLLDVLLQSWTREWNDEQQQLSLCKTIFRAANSKSKPNQKTNTEGLPLPTKKTGGKASVVILLSEIVVCEVPTLVKMGEAPDLFSLCLGAATKEIIHGDHLLQNIYELPPDLFDCLLMRLPPFALQKLQEMPFKDSSGYNNINGSSSDGRKRGRYGDFDTAWKMLFKSRWPEGVRQIQPVELLRKEGVGNFEPMNNSGEWRQLYWEAHLQNCLDKAAEIAFLPSFDGPIGEITIPETLLKCIGYDACIDYTACAHSKLSYHCQQFGCFARSLRLQNVICIAETCELLRGSKLQSLVFRGIKSEEHANGVCKLLNQNKETLSFLEFVHCKFSSTALGAICDSLYRKDIETHGIQYFSIKASSILENSRVSIPSGLLSFLSSGRTLHLVNFSDNRLGPNFAKMVFDTLLDASSDLSVLDLSDNNIAGWLSTWRFSACSLPSLGIGKSLQSLRVLNLRCNNLGRDDADYLKYALVCMPNLESLDISENPLEDHGIRSLIHYFVESSERETPLVDLKMENCELSSNGVAEVLRSLATLKNTFNTLSIANNVLGSHIAPALVKFMGTSYVRVLNVEDIDLGPSGFLELQEKIPEEVKLVHLNISKNRGGIETANFISKLILRAPELIAINAGYNFMPAESLAVIHSALKASKGKLERLDLTGNARCHGPAYISLLDEFQIHGRTIVILPSLHASLEPYDDDP
ncbi:hypothetical protein NE237_016278 [Protea cynaroides]|uniref:Uncharacterized protein n=1 Tax=Protea cynaroides TaxID=273540 RepID=A0A9Q0KFK1_9MAGN|nr:hypothetical protein NE237_016278 [Protea cynaroides]